MQHLCRNCGQRSELVPLFNDELVLKCSLCAAYQFVGPLENVAGLYTEDYYQGSEYINYELSAPVYKRNFERKLAVIKGHLPSARYEEMRVLEIGSATGNFMQVLQEHGVHHILGVEASEYSRRKASESGLRVIDPFSTEYRNLVADFAPTMVCAWDVWEHVENPSEVFTSLLTENAEVKTVAISTVDSGALIPRMRGKRWRQFHPPTHLNYPTKRSFDIFFKSMGFTVVSNTPFGYYRPLADYLSTFIPPSLLNKLPALFRIPLLINLRDIQLVIAQRD